MPDVIDNVKVGEYIKKLLKSHNMTQDNLAEKLCISKSAVSQNLRGKSSFDIQNLIQIAKLFNITLDELLNLKSEGVEEVISEYQKVVQKGLSAINSVPAENLRISEPDLYGKVLVDYIIEANQESMFDYLHQKKVCFVQDFYHRAKEIYLKIIRFMLEKGNSDVMDYILKYTELNGSFSIEDEKTSMIIWGLLDGPDFQSFIEKFIQFKQPQVTIWKKLSNEKKAIPITELDLIRVIAKYHLNSVFKTYLSIKSRDDYFLTIIQLFIEYSYVDGVHLYLDYSFPESVSWVRKSSIDVQKAFFEILKLDDFDLVQHYAKKDLFTDLTVIARQAILNGQDKIASYLIAQYHSIVNFKKIGEACIQIKNQSMLNNMISYFSKDDLNYLLSFVKLDDMNMVIFLLRQGARIEEKYYNLETFKKINLFIETVMNKEGD